MSAFDHWAGSAKISFFQAVSVCLSVSLSFCPSVYALPLKYTTWNNSPILTTLGKLRYLPDYIVDIDSVHDFKSQLNNFLLDQQITFDWKASRQRHYSGLNLLEVYNGYRSALRLHGNLPCQAAAGDRNSKSPHICTSSQRDSERVWTNSN